MTPLKQWLKLCNSIHDGSMLVSACRFLGTLLLLALLIMPLGALLWDVACLWTKGNHASLLSLLPMSSRQWQLLGASIVFSLSVTLSTMLIGVAVATWIFSRKNLTWISRLLLPVLIVIPPYLYAIIWASPLNAATLWQIEHGFIPTAITGWLNAWWAEVMSYLPLAIGSAIVGFSCVDPSLADAGRLSQSEGRVFRRIILPLALPGLYLGACIIFLFSLLEYGVPALFSISVYAMETFAQFSLDGQPGTAFITALPLMLLGAGILYSILGRIRQVATMRLQHTNTLLSPQHFSARWRIAQGLAVLLFGIQVLLPLLYLLCSVGSPVIFWQVASAAHNEVISTLILAVLVVLTGLPLSLLLATRLAQPGQQQRLWWVLVCIPLTLPASLLSIGIIAITQIRWVSVILPSESMTIMANLLRTLPIAALIGYVVLMRIDRQYFEAASLFQRSPFQGWWKVWLPLTIIASISNGVIIATRTFGELEATLLVVAPGSATIMMRLYNLLHYGASSGVSALTLLLVLLTGSASILVLAGLFIAKRIKLIGEQS